MIEKFFLQSSFVDQFQETFGTTGEGFSAIGVWLIPLIALVLTGVIVYILVRLLKIKFDYAGDGQRYGKFRIHVMGRYRIEGNLSKNETFLNSDDLDELTMHKNISVVPEKIKEMVKAEKLFVYDFRITDTSEAFDLTGSYKSSRIISSNKLESDEISWTDQKGERSLTSIFVKEYPRNVVAHHKSEHHEVLNPDRNFDDYWVIAPIPMIDAKKFGDGYLSNSYEIKVENIEGGKNLSTASSMIETLSESFRQIRTSREQVENMQDLVERKDKELAKQNIHINKLRHMMNQKVLVGFPEKAKQDERGTEWGWIIAGFFLGAVGIIVVPEIPMLAGKVPDWFGAVITIVILIAIRHMSEKQKLKDEYKNIEDEP